MPPRSKYNREKLAWTASVGLIVLQAFQVPGTLARQDDYEFVRTLVEVHRRVVDNYAKTVDEDKLNQAAIDGMLAQLDPNCTYVPPADEQEFNNHLNQTFQGIGIRPEQRPDGQIEIITPVDGSPAAKAGIQAGDVILAVDDYKLTRVDKLPDVIKRIGGKPGTEVAITVKHLDDAVATYKLTRADIHSPVVKGYRRKPDNSWDYLICDDPKIGYVRLTQFTPESYHDLRGAIEPLVAGGAKGVILDLRFNPGGQLDQAESICNMLLPADRVIVTTKGRARPEYVRKSDGKDTLPEFPLIVLVNEHSASAAEVVSGCLLDNKRALIVGERSYGKGSVQERIQLDNKGEVKLTVAYYYLPSGRLVDKHEAPNDWGVLPQISVPMDAVTEERVLVERDHMDEFRRAVKKPATRATTGSTTLPTVEPAEDVQLSAAVHTMLGVVVFNSHPPTTMPAR